ncbi:hypothetical protein GTA08_BOTSDO07973 [Botryosphaeria dothidea]|uniref:Copper transport protein n=1 Tax=Botryosphaeria dothidea TaxID=55169 RepID=A0A8H4N077_9PEZI|nr:hypothetical protein GTA08_BOTSDO07973 [Botryosphaeria dothidea]
MFARSMDMPESTGSAPSTGMATMPSMHSTSTSGMDMGMASTFSTGTHVMLFFDGWTTDSSGAYAGTILLLFMLSVFHRFLGSLRTQLEKVWLDHPHNDEEAARNSGSSRQHERKWDSEKREKPATYLADDGAQETEPLSPSIPGAKSCEDISAAQRVWEDSESPGYGRRSPFGRPSVPWHWRKDGSRALLEFTRAALGYLL